MRLSIIVATLNRRALLLNCLASIARSAGNLRHEIIIVDGGSTDGTLETMRARKDVRLIEQGQALGCVKAYNAGFRAAVGEYVAAINDDAVYERDTLQRAVRFLDVNHDAGQVAIAYGERGGNEVLHTQKMWIGNDRTGRCLLLYANFSVTRRWLGEHVGWWGEFLTHYGGDCEFSAKIWQAGWRVVELPGGAITHLATKDKTRRDNGGANGGDEWMRKWFKIDLPATVIQQADDVRFAHTKRKAGR